MRSAGTASPKAPSASYRSAGGRHLAKPFCAEPKRGLVMSFFELFYAPLDFKRLTYRISRFLWAPHLAHIDPSGIGHAHSSKAAEATPRVMEICATSHAAVPDSGIVNGDSGHSPKSVTIDRNPCSRQIGIVVHDPPESPVTVDRNTHPEHVPTYPGTIAVA